MCSDSYPIPILSLFFLYHPNIPYFLIQRFFYFLVVKAGLVVVEVTVTVGAVPVTVGSDVHAVFIENQIKAMERTVELTFIT